jgi:hypothetical protein
MTVAETFTYLMAECKSVVEIASGYERDRDMLVAGLDLIQQTITANQARVAASETGVVASTSSQRVVLNSTSSQRAPGKPRNTRFQSWWEYKR